MTVISRRKYAGFGLLVCVSLGMSELTPEKNRASGTALEVLNYVVCYKCAINLIFKKSYFWKAAKDIRSDFLI